MPWGPQCLALLSSYTVSLQNCPSVPLVLKQSSDPTFLPLLPCQVPLSPCQVPPSFAEGNQLCRGSYRSRKQAFSSLQELAVHAFPWSCAMIGVSCPGAFRPSVAPFLPCLDSLPAPANVKTDKASPKHFFKPAFHFPACSSAFSQTSTDCHASLIQGHTHNPLFRNTMHKCFQRWLVVHQKASYNSSFYHNIIKPSWTWNGTWNGVGYRIISKYENPLLDIVKCNMVKWNTELKINSGHSREYLQ